MTSSRPNALSTVYWAMKVSKQLLENDAPTLQRPRVFKFKHWEKEFRIVGAYRNISKYLFQPEFNLGQKATVKPSLG